MSLKILLAFCFVYVFISCKDSNSNSSKELIEETVESTQIISQVDISKLKYTDFGLDTKAEKLMEDWGEYIQFQQLIQKIKKADFSELKGDSKALKASMEDFKRSIPASLNSASILARVMVFETKLFKMESLVNLYYIDKAEFSGALRELLQAFSNLNFQINKKLERDSQNVQKPI